MSKLNQFFNVIPSSGGEATLLLYGEVGDWSEVSAREVVTRLLELTNTYKKIDIRINSGGGEVYCGLAIYEAYTSTALLPRWLPSSPSVASPSICHPMHA